MPDYRRRERRRPAEWSDRLRHDGHCCSHRLTDVRSTHRSTRRPAHHPPRSARHSRDLRRTGRISGASLDREPANGRNRRPRDGHRLGYRGSTGSEAGPLFLRLRRVRVRSGRTDSDQYHSTGARLCVLTGDSARSADGRPSPSSRRDAGSDADRVAVTRTPRSEDAAGRERGRCVFAPRGIRLPDSRSLRGLTHHLKITSDRGKNSF
jgi:hypothetical protein